MMIMHKMVLIAAIILFSSVSARAQTCTKVVSFALADATGVHPFMGTGNWIGKWVQANSKKYPDVCFSQVPIQDRTNCLVVLSQSPSYFTGFDPVVRTNTNTATTPVSGQGTITNSYGETWNYRYNGTDTTTTTTTTQENVPYTISSNTVYAYAYGNGGAIVSRHYHVYSTKSGGDAANSAGYNIGNAIAAIKARGRLLSSDVKDIESQPVTASSVQQPPQVSAAVSSADPSAPPPPSRPSSSPSCKIYANTGEKEPITDNASGEVLILSDGSIWEIMETDRIDSALWLPVDDVIVMRAENPIACFNYTIINLDEHAEKVQAQYLGEK